MTALDVRIRGSRIDLPADGRGRLVLEVPREPMKVDRGTVIFPWHPGGTDRLIVKVYGEMGVFNWLRKQVVGHRAGREFRTLRRLRDAGVRCCEPMFWGTGRSPVYGLFEVVATRAIPDVVTLAERAPSLGLEARTEIVGRLFEGLARVHRAGVFHGAFFLTNVLVGAGADATSVPWIIDLEKSVCFASDVRGTRMADFDLWCALVSTFVVMGGGYAHRALERYGLDDREIDRVFAGSKRTRSSKRFRYRRRAEFLARGVVSRAIGAWPPGLPHLESR